LKEKGKVLIHKKLYKRIEYPKGYDNLKKKKLNLLDSESKLGAFTITQSKRDLKNDDFGKSILDSLSSKRH
jgi:hypothetical protein